MRLYKIDEMDILKAMDSPDFSGREGERLVSLKKFPNRFSGYPLKVIYKKTEGNILVITAYPLKRKHWR